MSQQLWGTRAQQVNYECFYQGEWWSAMEHEESPMSVFIRVNGEVQWSMMSQPWGFFIRVTGEMQWSMSHPWGFLSGWMVQCSGAWWVNHEGFYQGEWRGAVEHDESIHEGFYLDEWGGAVEWGNSGKVLDQATVEMYWIRQQWKSTGSCNIGNVLDQATVEKYRISAHCSCTASETLDLLPLKRSVGQQR